jgi:PPK2 family polyphosphate:nucleotide phosphotransferase
MVKDTEQYLAKAGKEYQTARLPTGHDGGLDKKKAKKLRKDLTKEMRKLQDKLYAQDRYAMLIIFQAMDAAGKDSAIKHVMSGVNPQGCQVFSFKQPSHNELDHDYLWRANRSLPERGRIGIFNRSYYEEVLVARVHPEIVCKQRLPGIYSVDDIPKGFWEQRLRQIRDYERYLSENGIVILKFFLNLSKQEQRKRFIRRIERPDKNWKFSMADVKERTYWAQYQEAYSAAISSTTAAHAPWYTVPADHKWYARLVISQVIVDTMKGLGLKYPQVTKMQKENIDKAYGSLKKG